MLQNHLADFGGFFMKKDKEVWAALFLVIFNRIAFKFLENFWPNNMLFVAILKSLSVMVTCASIYILIKYLWKRYQPIKSR